MKEGWEIKKLSDICESIKNIRWIDIPTSSSFPYIDLSAVDRNNSAIISSQLINNTNAPSRAKQIVKSEDVIFATTRPTLRRLCIIPPKYNDAICSTGFCVLRHNKEVLTKWIFYSLKCDVFYAYIEPLQKGANYPAITDGEVKKYTIPVPPLSEQKRIVDILDREFARIDALKANAIKSYHLARELFDKNLKEEYKGSDYLLGDVLNLRRGHDLTHRQMLDGDIPVAGSGGVIGYHNNETKIKPCIVVGRSGSIGKVYIYDKCWAHNTVLYVDDFKGNNPFYLKYLLVSLDLTKKGGGCGVPTLNRNFLHPMKIGFNENPLEQGLIVERLDKLNERCRMLKRNYLRIGALCEDMKQALLKKAFSGEL